MIILGVTGPSGAGKSMFCLYLSQAGCRIFDCDAIYHELTDAPSPCTRELASPENFGPSILRDDGSLDRRALAALVFAPENGNLLERLNHISHRHVALEIQARLEEARRSDCPPSVAVIDAPLLFQANMEGICDMTVALVAGRKSRLQRLTQRDALGEEALNARLDAAPPDTYYTQRADRTVVNDGTLSDLQSKAQALVRELTEE